MKFSYFTLFLSLLLLREICPVSAQDYSVGSIKPEMIKNASAVIRLEEASLEIKSEAKATYHFRQVVTILNENALQYSIYRGYKSKLISYSFDKITIYDSNGKKVKSFGGSHVKPFTPYSINLYDDNFYYYVDPEYIKYPFTAEITYSEDFNGIFVLPGWRYYEDYNVSCEKSTYAVTAPESYKLRIRELNLKSVASVSHKEGLVKYEWAVSDLPALVNERQSVSLRKYSPAVLLAPSDFEINGLKGNAETWESLGNFQANLDIGTDILEGPVVDSIQMMINDNPGTKEIVERIYKFMQNRTRYISVQVGIGGLKPIPAQKVNNAHYGDCKGLSNYTRALLKVAGIKSFYTCIYAGDDADDIVADFPSDQSNHVILCVPTEKDTIWLECTSQKQPFNYLGDFTDDRHALIITDIGGKLVKTPRYTVDQNRKTTCAFVKIDPVGNATATVSEELKYIFYDENAKYLYYDNAGQRKSLENNIDIPGFTLTYFTIKQSHRDIPVLNLNLSLKLTKYSAIMGDRMLIPLNLMNHESRLPSSVSDRKMDIEFKRDMSVVDTVTYAIPSGFSVKNVPQPVEYTSQFGHYHAEVIVNGKELKYIRSLNYNKGVFPASQYPQLVEFTNNIATADNMKIALKRL